ncbi:MAG: 50S ribosomal protein L5 [Patescibacteria group bacterium]|nr:50S ribosomal protein L5 [Patescibacteria group bacterium]
MSITKEKLDKSLSQLKSELNETNLLALPRLTKIVVNTGLGRNRDKKHLELVTDRLAKITGQKVSTRGAKKSVASFKVREGDIIGAAVTLRGGQMWGFLDKLLNVAIPRIRDFRGFEIKSIDDVGNLSIGIKEHTIFPETADEDLKDVFGMTITLATTAGDKKVAQAFFRAMGFPFKK